MASNPRGVALLERLDAVLANPALYRLAEVVPDQPAGGGRRRDYPAVMLILYEALISIYGSARQVEAELAHPAVWLTIRRAVKAASGVDLPARPMRRYHYLYGRSRYLTDPDVLAQLQALHRQLAANAARSLGLLDPDGGGSWTHPDPQRVIYGDGKVVTPLYKTKPGDTKVDRRTGEVRAIRYEPDAELHYEGTGDTAWGTKFTILAARGAEPRARIILDWSFVADKGGEAKTALESVERVLPHLPGTQALVYDTALRGVHHQHLLRDLGIIPINRVTAAEAGSRDPRRGEGRRVEKSTFVETKQVSLPDGSTRILQLFSRGGALGVAETDDTGDVTFTELDRIRTHRAADRNGRYRWYNDYQLPAEQGDGATITVRLHGNDEDTRRRFNRTENLRPIPPTDPDFRRLFRIRNDAESINRGLEDTLYLRRAHSVGHRRQLVNLLGWALVINSVALREHELRTAAPPAA
jgi:hypothetical protein